MRTISAEENDLDAQQFTENKTGRLVTITTPRKDFAFIPDLLPIDWAISRTMWPLIAEARQHLGTLNGIGQILPHPELLLSPLQRREAITSSIMEGTYVTPEQLLLYEKNPDEPKSTTDKRSDWQEVHNYNRALQMGRTLLIDQPFSGNLIRQMHQILMGGVQGRLKSPGQYRLKQVQIGASARFVPPPASEVSLLMDNLIAYINSTANEELDPIVKSLIAHYQFEAIHPLGRLLLSLMVHKDCQLSHPWLYLSPFFERHKEDYIEHMFKISTRGDWGQWIEFCLRGVIAQALDAINRCHLFHRCRDDYHNRLTSSSARMQQIVESLFATPIVTVIDIKERFQIHYQTAKTDIDRLVEAGILAEMEGMSPKSFYARRIYQIAYSDNPEEV